MIGTGLVALALSTIEHRRYVKQIRSEYEAAPRSLTLVVAAIVSVMGLLAFFATLFGG